MKKQSSLVTHSCIITYARNASYFVFTHESQRIGKEYIHSFPWRKKDVFAVAEEILATLYFDGDIKRCKEAIKVLSLTKPTHPSRTVYKK